MRKCLNSRRKSALVDSLVTAGILKMDCPRGISPPEDPMKKSAIAAFLVLCALLLFSPTVFAGESQLPNYEDWPTVDMELTEVDPLTVVIVYVDNLEPALQKNFIAEGLREEDDQPYTIVWLEIFQKDESGEITAGVLRLFLLSPDGNYILATTRELGVKK